MSIEDEIDSIGTVQSNFRGYGDFIRSIGVMVLNLKTCLQDSTLEFFAALRYMKVKPTLRI